MNKALKAAKRVLPVFKKTIDAWVEGMLTNDQNARVSCKKGCNHCCYQMVKATMAEGAAVAAHLLEKGTFEQFRPRLEETSRLADKVGEKEGGTMEYFKTKTPCAFLKDGECAVYEVRPAICRSYYVATDPKNCSPDRPGAEVGIVDDRFVMSHFVDQILKTTHPAIPANIGPFASVVLAGKELIERSPGSFKRLASRSTLFTANYDPLLEEVSDSPV